MVQCKLQILVASLAALLGGCASPPAPPASTPAPIQAPPAVVGSEPSERVAAFYYPWHGNPETDGKWIHWGEPVLNPPAVISSDFYPQLGLYSSADPAAVAQHMAWLREAGVGVVITSWWGRDSREDRMVPLLLSVAQRYGIKVAFHIEPYQGRNPNRLVADVTYLSDRYGSSPAFFRRTDTTPFSPGSHAKGVYFVWEVGRVGRREVPPTNWHAALDRIHSLPGGALVIAHSTQSSWVDDGHFDGLYNYATLHLEKEGGFDWARTVPKSALYVPSVIPGFSAVRIKYPPDANVPRNEGATYDDQWERALGTGVEPALVTITSFNEWHEGSMIEPAVAARGYADFGPLAPDSYLNLTRKWVDVFLASEKFGSQ
jgi:glycoprotein endo-alpha-1,2-mannosidase